MKKNYIVPCFKRINLQTEQPLLSASVQINNDKELDASESYSIEKESMWDNQEW